VSIVSLTTNLSYKILDGNETLDYQQILPQISHISP